MLPAGALSSFLVRLRGALAFVLCAAFATVFAATAAGEQGHTVTDETCGVVVTLPGPDWTLRDMSVGTIVGHIYSPDKSIVPRFSLVQKSRSLAPAGMDDRARELSTGGRDVSAITDTTFAGVPARRLDWPQGGVHGIEFGLERGGAYLVVQVAASESAWRDAAQAAELKAIFDSVRLVPAKDAQVVVKVDPSTPAQVRAARRAAAPPPRRFAIRSHDVHVVIHPEKRHLACRDALRVEALEDGIDALDLRTYLVQIDSLRLAGADLPREPRGGENVRVRLPTALRKGEVVTLEFAAHSDDYFLEVDQKLLVELAVLGQVRPESTWSSHVFYYPIDAANDAAVRLRITVPKPYVAVSGGVAEPPQESGEGEGASTTRTFTLDARPRILPAGFAVAKYERLDATLNATTDATAKGGLAIELYFLAGEEAKAKRFLDIALRAGALFEQRMGPLPWGRVAFCHVRPETKDMGVSLPGLVLFSDRYFDDRTSHAELRGVDVVNGGTGSMIVVDELGHQWNGYAAPYPNELAEGISTFLCMLYTERQAGEVEYRSALRTAAEHYLAEAERHEDVALASPRIYRNRIYRAVAFAKTAVVLDLLRQRLGDERFFAGWRAAFASPPKGRSLDFDDFRAALEKASGQDLGPFFDQWFFRAGHPRLRIAWKATLADGRPAAQVTITQEQPGEPFELPLELDVHAAEGDVRREIVLRRREETFTVETRGVATGVALDPRGRSPLFREVGR